MPFFKAISSSTLKTKQTSSEGCCREMYILSSRSFLGYGWIFPGTSATDSTRSVVDTEGKQTM